MWRAPTFRGVRQTLDDYHLSEPLYALAHLLYPNNSAGAKAWVDQKMGALSLAIPHHGCSSSTPSLTRAAHVTPGGGAI
jgi:hypothetical protein